MHACSAFIFFNGKLSFFSDEKSTVLDGCVFVGSIT